MSSSTISPHLSESQQQFLSEMDTLAESVFSPQELLTEMLPRLVKLQQAFAGIIWAADPQGNLRMVLQDQWNRLGIMGNEPKMQQHRQLIMKAASGSQVILISPENHPLEEMPGLFTFALIPVKQHNRLLYIIELALNPVYPEKQQPGLIQVLEFCSGLLLSFQDREQDPFLPMGSPGFWERMEEALIRVYQQLDSKKLSYEASHEISHTLAVERVSILGLTGRNPKLLAINGQSQVPYYSPVVKHLRQLTKLVLRAGIPLMHTGKQPVTLPEWIGPLSDYLSQSGGQMLAIYPLYSRPKEDVPPPEPNKKQNIQRRIVGALVVERSRSSKFDNQRQKVLELWADHLGNALDKAQQHEAVFLLPLFRGIGNTWRWLMRHQFWQTVAAITAFTLFTLAMVVVPWDYRVTGQGRLMPVVQKQAFAPWDADVEEVFVKGGERVRKGDKLVLLRNKEVEAEEIRLRTTIDERDTSIRALRAARESVQRTNDKQEALDIEGRLAEQLVEIEHLKAQHRLIKERLESLLISSPIDGIVVTFQVNQLLLNRPVSRGEVLLEVMDPNPTGEWQLELKVEDRRLGHIIARQEKTTFDLPVEYILVTSPEYSYPGKLKEIGTRTNIDQEQGNILDVQVAIPEDQRPKLHIGAEVKAKINCGPKPLGYVLFGDVIDYLRQKLWL